MNKQMNLLERVQAMPLQGAALPFNGFVRYREKAGTGIPYVLLHGIGSGSASWIYQLESQGAQRVLAWDAPGYADSTALKPAIPVASDYAGILWAWLDALEIPQIHLVGHSLGCIMAAAGAIMQPQRIASLTLLAPAQGYANAPHDVREKKRDERLKMFAEMGPQKMAQLRASALFSEGAAAHHVAVAAYAMARLNAGGYAQATQLLAHANIAADLKAFQATRAVPITIACGEADTVTPFKACASLAQSMGLHCLSLGNAGHLCAVQAHEQVNALLGLKGALHARQ